MQKPSSSRHARASAKVRDVVFLLAVDFFDMWIHIYNAVLRPIRSAGKSQPKGKRIPARILELHSNMVDFVICFK